MQCTIFILIEFGPHAQMHGCANLLICFCFYYFYYFWVKSKANQKQAVKLVFGFGINVFRKENKKMFLTNLIWSVFLSQNMGPFRPHHISTLPTIFGGKMFYPARVSLTATMKTTASSLQF